MYSVLVVHPNKDAAEVLASWLQRCEMLALPLTDAVDAIEHVENLRFDLAVVSKNLPPELPQLLLDSHRAPWLEILELRDGWVYPEEFVLAVSKFAQESRWMRFLIADAWYAALYGEAGYDPIPPRKKKACQTLPPSHKDATTCGQGLGRRFSRRLSWRPKSEEFQKDVARNNRSYSERVSG